MRLQDLTNDMRRHTGGCGVITIKQLADYMNQSHPQSVREKYCKGLEAFEGKYYFIPDVAARIYATRKIK